MIQINEYNVETVELYDPKHNLIGIVNKDELLDVRIQIAEQKLSGYYFVWSNEDIEENSNCTRYYIAPDGMMEDFPEGLWNTSLNLIRKLRKIRKIMC